MTEQRLSQVRESAGRLTLFALLLANTALQTAGGAMMLAKPQKLALETFGIEIAVEAEPLVTVIGGATLSYALLSGAAAVGVLRRRAWAHLSVVLLGSMLIAVGAVMVTYGMRIGSLDLAKGLVFVVGGGVYHSRSGSPMRA
jgi:hypothetical protein